jgi:tRNA 5-methylaminomethyl-2-thiouridine biosynthesis bifunctional protein
MVLKSAKFDDVYFSADGGMDETHHVFVNGNDLPAAWAGTNEFVIAETGFGTGLNFLCAWKLFDETANDAQRLHFISVEKYPLSSDEIMDALSMWDDDLGNYIRQMIAQYPIRVPGAHDIDIASNVRLTLWFGDVNDFMVEWTGTVDAWFLDGFTPAKNPDMWSDTLFSNMARLSHSKTTYATFTAAGFVRRGLQQAGFSVEKIKGFGRKRDMVRGRFIGGDDKPSGVNRTVAIIGGGLAGCAAAKAFVNNGDKVTIYEAGDSLASEASGGKLGMINPKLTAKPSPQCDYYTAAYANALRDLQQFADIDFSIHGSLHLCTNEDKNRRFTGYIQNLGWHGDHIERRGDDLFYPDGASVCPYKLCHALAQGADVHLNHTVDNLDDLDADIIIIANGYQAVSIIESIPLSAVRGQVSWVKPMNGIDTNICFGGYITPQTADGVHMVGASFEPWSDSTEITNKNHNENLDKYNVTMGANLSMDDIVGGWAALRTASKDRFPIVGHIRDNVYISTAHGSHGIISSMMAARIIVGQVTNGHVPATRAVQTSLSLKRFHKY